MNSPKLAHPYLRERVQWQENFEPLVPGQSGSVILVAEVKEPNHEGEFSIERLILATGLVQANPMRFRRQLSRDLPECPL